MYSIGGRIAALSVVTVPMIIDRHVASPKPELIKNPSLVPYARLSYPSAFLGGVQGQVFYIIPVLAMLVMLMSLVECKFMLPAHIAHSLKGPQAGKLSRPWFEKVEDAYESLMMKVIPHRYWFAAITLVVFGTAAVLATRNLVVNFAPETNTDIIFVKAEGPVGTSFLSMERKLSELEQELREYIPASELNEIVVTTQCYQTVRRQV